MIAILGISAFYHDLAAAIVVDGEIVAAAQEERFCLKKHNHRFPQHAIDHCLKQAGLTPIILTLLVVGGFVILGSTAAAPFIHTLF